MYTTGNHIEIKKRQYLFHSWLEKWFKTIWRSFQGWSLEITLCSSV